MGREYLHPEVLLSERLPGQMLAAGTKAPIGKGAGLVEWALIQEDGRSVISNLGRHWLLRVLIGVLALSAAVTGITIPGIYSGLVSPELLPGAYSQDHFSGCFGRGDTPCLDQPEHTAEGADPATGVAFLTPTESTSSNGRDEHRQPD